MAKYDPLIAHLNQTKVDDLRMSFREVEAVLGERLPDSARKYQAWWANSAPGDSHTWAHAWQAAGWKASANVASGMVDFHRVAPVAASPLDALRPTSRKFVMDLVKLAGIDVSEWEFTSDGQPVKSPRANPRFCYDWSFGSPEEGYVLCVWHKDLDVVNGRIVYVSASRSHTKKLRERLQRAGVTQEQRGRLVQQIRRSEAFEAAVTFSYHAERPLRIVLNLGDTRTEEELADVAAAVSERELDPEEWFVHRLNDGDALLVRGERPPKLAETSPGATEPPESPGEDDKWREGQVRVRQGQSEFRARLLEAYQRRCAVTGCVLEPILEAAHIIPHSLGTDYRATNGLLLRADIHTLYDLHHLSIDSFGRIHLSQEARRTEYRQYEGRTITLPARASQAPAASNLDSRHKRFLAREAERL